MRTKQEQHVQTKISVLHKKECNNHGKDAKYKLICAVMFPVNILRKSISGRHRPVRVAVDLRRMLRRMLAGVRYTETYKDTDAAWDET